VSDTLHSDPEPLAILNSLRDRIERMLDSERLLPADGQALLDMLQQAEVRIATGETGEAEGLLLGFEALLKALTDSGVLDHSASETCMAQVRAATDALNT
jgi:hypothetical protein